MKIGILTQPIHINYGGTLQAYALQKVLKDLGHEAWLVRREPYLKHSIDYWIRTNIGNIIRYLRHQELRRWTWLGPKPTPSRSIVEKNIQAFADRWIKPKTAYIYNSESLYKDYLEKKYDVYIVGSDQVWRPRYNSSSQRSFWLDFLKDDHRALRIAYAASFGTDIWEYKGKLYKDCRDLAHQFDAISVREDSGQRLLDQYMGINNAVHVLDPTMLLTRTDYENIVIEENVPSDNGIILSYLLDFDDKNIRITDEIAQEKQLRVKSIRPQKKTVDYNIGEDENLFVIPPVTEWLRAFMDAEYVITDSFHGTVFAIIFNKPFVTLGNSVRGGARLESLLRLFNLERRFVTDVCKENVKNILSEDINWQNVNDRHDELRRASMNFLIKSLNSRMNG